MAWMEGFEAERPNEFTQLVVSAIADNPTTSLTAGPPPPQGADFYSRFNRSANKLYRFLVLSFSTAVRMARLLPARCTCFFARVMAV